MSVQLKRGLPPSLSPAFSFSAFLSSPPFLSTFLLRKKKTFPRYFPKPSSQVSLLSLPSQSNQSLAERMECPEWLRPCSIYLLGGELRSASLEAHGCVRMEKLPEQNLCSLGKGKWVLSRQPAVRLMQLLACAWIPLYAQEVLPDFKFREGELSAHHKCSLELTGGDYL